MWCVFWITKSIYIPLHDAMKMNHWLKMMMSKGKLALYKCYTIIESCFMMPSSFRSILWIVSPLGHQAIHRDWPHSPWSAILNDTTNWVDQSGDQNREWKSCWLWNTLVIDLKFELLRSSLMWNLSYGVKISKN
jgi:hypothetical protein